MKSSTAKMVIEDPTLIIRYLLYKGCTWLSDETYLKIEYRLRMKKRLKLLNPITFNEKLQWLKLYDRRLEYISMSDKYEAKIIAAKKIGEQYIIPTLGVWDKFEDIDFDSLPNQFVLKCTHDSGGVVICKDKVNFNIKAAKKKINSRLKQNFYYKSREWYYKNIKPRIIAEKYIADEYETDLIDYKFFCFDGQAKIMFIATDRNNDAEETKFDFYDMDFNHLQIINGHPNSPKRLKKPSKFDEMRRLAGSLTVGIPQVRIDFYEVNGQVYFGEFTFGHWAGMVPFEPEEWDLRLGEWIKLPGVKMKT